MASWAENNPGGDRTTAAQSREGKSVKGGDRRPSSMVGKAGASREWGVEAGLVLGWAELGPAQSAVLRVVGMVVVPGGWPDRLGRDVLSGIFQLSSGPTGHGGGGPEMAECARGGAGQQQQLGGYRSWFGSRLGQQGHPDHGCGVRDVQSVWFGPCDGSGLFLVSHGLGGHFRSGRGGPTLDRPAARGFGIFLPRGCGCAVSLSAEAEGPGPRLYPWFRVPGEVVAGQVRATLLLPAVSLAEAGEDFVVVSNPHGAVTSTVARQTVRPAGLPLPNFAHVGFAEAGFALPGGAGARWVTATTAGELKAYADSNARLVIPVTGTLCSSGMDIHVRSHKSIIGGGTSASLIGGGLDMDNSSNIIVWNLSILNSSEDGIGIRSGFNRIWMDHCTITDARDGLMDIAKGSDLITVSWCRFFYTNTANSHRFACLAGAKRRGGRPGCGKAACDFPSQLVEALVRGTHALGTVWPRACVQQLFSCARQPLLRALPPVCRVQNRKQLVRECAQPVGGGSHDRDLGQGGRHRQSACGRDVPWEPTQGPDFASRHG